jgi:transposase-like protein
VVPKNAQDAVAAIVRTIFAQPDHASAMTQLHEVARLLTPKFPQVAELLEDAAEDVLAHLHFPQSTAAGCTRRTLSSGFTRRSSVGPESSESSPLETY